MTDGRFIPRSARADPDARANYVDVLLEGVPDHLQPSVMKFLMDTTTGSDVPAIEAALRRPMIRQTFNTGHFNLRGSILATWKEARSDDWVLDLIDHRLHHLPDLWTIDGDAERAATALAAALRDGGSAYEVILLEERDQHGRPRLALEDRVDSTIRSVAEATMQRGKSGDHLRVAWVSLYGRSASPNEAYGHAIKAVEAAAAPIVIPKASEPTLGQIVKALRDAPDGKFVMVLTGKNDAADSVNVVRLMGQLLWTHDHARHGTADETKPIAVSKEEAEAAMHLAVTLVQWFECGAIRMTV